jgi:peptide deformylase
MSNIDNKKLRAVIGNPGISEIVTIFQLLTMAAEGRKKIEYEEFTWERSISKHPLQVVPSPLLRKKCRPAAGVDEASEIVQHLLLAMCRTFKQQKPAGFSANQFGFDLRVIAFMYDTETVMCLINPEILKVSGKTSVSREGCFSVPNRVCSVPRPKFIKVRGTLPDGSTRSIKAHDYLARVICHEMDHIDGKLIIDY